MGTTGFQLVMGVDFVASARDLCSCSRCHRGKDTVPRHLI